MPAQASLCLLRIEIIESENTSFDEGKLQIF